MTTTIQYQAIKTGDRLSCHEIAKDHSECLQQEAFAHGKEDGNMAITHQKFVAAAYLNLVINSITEGQSSVGPRVVALKKNSFKVGR
jgi:hypothetical protein